MALPLPKLFESIFQGLLVFGAPAIYPIVLAVMLMRRLLRNVGSGATRDTR